LQIKSYSFDDSVIISIQIDLYILKLLQIDYLSHYISLY